MKHSEVCDKNAPTLAGNDSAYTSSILNSLLSSSKDPRPDAQLVSLHSAVFFTLFSNSLSESMPLSRAQALL